MRSLAVLCLIGSLAVAWRGAAAQEVQAPVSGGLAIWLDAAQLPALKNGDRVEVWRDVSGYGRHATQQDPAARPVFQDGALRFDGEKTFLELANLEQSFTDLTVVVVAAPLSNLGVFRALLAMNQEGKNDYTSGLNLDLGPGRTRRLTMLNAEGSGFGGATNLLKDASEFGAVRRIVLTSTPGPGGTKLYLDGKPQASRDRAPSRLHMDRLTVGARRYNNEGGAPNSRGFFEGDLFEVLLYERVLSEAELAKLDGYLVGRYGREKSVAMPRRSTVGKPLVSVANPPAVQMFVSGFAARELAVDLPNINNVKYRPDGKLVALAYNGDVYLVSDERGSPHTEKAELFWESQGRLRAPIGMALTPPGYSHGTGLFVASKGKLSLIVDTDHDDKADKEIVVAQGWKELPHGVDALGVALDAAGNVYFGLGTTDYTNAYQVDKQGQPHYDLASERGTILKVSADFSRREVLCTGIRFPVALAINRHGDLFATDQEGATWLPNGNPFDELLHIQPGRHYGFPPRHARHLPHVIDEPSVFDYRPQHQSTCGLNFNEPVNGGPVFGPAHWAGDALVTGYSRGKLYRTKLAKTSAGYVAQNQVIACLNMLPADACVTPQGELLVAVHSGLPDWGTGPSGKGKLFKIEYQDRETPQPVLAWAAGLQEVHIAYDRPLDFARLGDLVGHVSIEYGEFVGAGDRFESQRPGYEIVQRQLDAPRFELPVLASQVSQQGRTLVLNTAQHPFAANYAVTLPAPAIDLCYDLCGVAATWKSDDGSREWSGWLPHVDLAVARALTAGSAVHDQLWSLFATSGRLTLHTKLDLTNMLRPAVQPGSKIDYELPAEKVTLTFTSSGPLQVTMPPATRSGEASRVAVTVTPKAGEALPLEIALTTNPQTTLEATWSTQEDQRPRALPLRRLMLPWAAAKSAAEAEQFVKRDIPQLKGGDWLRGRDVFHSQEARCAACHPVRGRGGNIGADLSNLIHRDYDSVLRDIRLPSAAINPDYVSYVVALTDGRVLQGTLRSAGDKLLVSDAKGQQTTIDRSDIDTLSPSPLSIMPEGLDKALGPEKLRDLLTFLLTEPLEPATLEIEGAPDVRRRAEVEAVLLGNQPIVNPRKLHIVLASGPKDHGPGEHDYPLWQRRWSALLPLAEGVKISTAEGWPTAKQFDEADVIVFYSNNPGWSAVRAAELDRFLARGRGLAYIHYAVDGHRDVEALRDRIGLAWRGGASRFRHGDLEIDFSRTQHPIARNFGKLRLVDESYWRLVGDPAGVTVLGAGVEDGQPQPLVWTREQGPGRVFVSIPGHYNWTFDDPLFRLLLLRGIAWTAHESVDRFNELTTVGARLGP